MQLQDEIQLNSSIQQLLFVSSTYLQLSELNAIVISKLFSSIKFEANQEIRPTVISEKCVFFFFSWGKFHEKFSVRYATWEI
jgi:hypothetical protein